MSLVEVLIGLLIVGLTGGVVISLSLQIFASNSSARTAAIANALSLEGLEQARSFVQTNGWAALAAKTNGCYADGSFGLAVPCLSPSPNCQADGQAVPASPLFRRSVSLTVNAGSRQIIVNSGVIWKDRELCRKNLTTTVFYNY